MTGAVILDIEVPGTPVPWMRPRRNGNRAFTHPKDAKHRMAIGLLAAAQTSGAPARGPLAMDLVFHLPIPVSSTKARRAAMVSGEERPTSSGDIDNLAKAVLDALTGIAYVDDRQVAQLTTSKHYSDRPRTEIRCLSLTTELQ